MDDKLGRMWKRTVVIYFKVDTTPTLSWRERGIARNVQLG
jgi:hypothetical protein